MPGSSCVHALWPGADRAAHAREIERFFAGKLASPPHVLMAFEDHRALGFAEINIRAYAEGCTTDRVGFLVGPAAIAPLETAGLLALAGRYEPSRPDGVPDDEAMPHRDSVLARGARDLRTSLADPRTSQD